ncbi:MAG: nucleoside kinase [Anaerolineae bacterium]|nr:nucleoside kinase [Anaerolineae bacterium]MDW8100770.1 nucleoside kinase [Anaerolineae bacterium]
MAVQLAEATRVWRAEARTTAQVRFPDGQVYEGPIGTRLEAFIQAAYPDQEVPIVAALVDGELHELTMPVTTDITVKPLTMHTSDGMRVYRRSLTLLLIAAAAELFPDARIYVDHSLTFGGYFCQVRGREPFTPAELTQIEAHMREIVEADEPITKERLTLAEAIAFFEQRGDTDKVRLLKYRTKDYLVLYGIRGTRDYFPGYMVPSTGYLRWFALRPYPPGFVLQFPRRIDPTRLQPFQDYPKLVAVFREYGEWMRLMHVEDVGGLNEAIANNRIREVILVSEALHEQRIAQIAQEILARRPPVRVVLIAGPSSSGKTTFARRLSIQLLANGLRPFALGMDDYFVDRERTPKDEEGNYDYESLEALDLALFNEHLLRLMNGEAVQLPSYNFRTGRREQGRTVQLSREHIILAEGIHGLNPALVPQIPPEHIYRIYVSALTQLNLDQHNRVPTTDTRLIRRIVRDATYRGYSAKETIRRWESVRRGERRYIFPYQEHADVMFNSALLYELAVLRPLAEPLLLQIEPRTEEYIEAKRLLAFLQWFLPVGTEWIPDNSILREFIGGSILEDFSLVV